MELKKGDIVKHFKGHNLIEKNIYEIVSVNPEYTGTGKFTEEPIIVYSSLFQDGKNFVREESDLIQELSLEEQEEYGQEHRIDLLTDEELNLIQSQAFINAKLAYINEKYGKNKSFK